MASLHKMAELLVMSVIALSHAHNELMETPNESIESYSSGSGSSGSSTSNEIQRDDNQYAQKNPSNHGSGLQEGIPIESPQGYRRQAETTVETTSQKPVYPPLNMKYRRIFNPDESASIEEYPFMAALLVNDELWCGGVVLDRDRILTAAHCLQLQYNNRFFREYVKMLSVRVGSTNATAGGELLRVTEIAFHPNYKPDTLDFNVALLRVHKNMTFGKKDPYVSNIDYLKENIIPIDNNITFLGWGSVLSATTRGGQVLLQKVELPIYDLADCQAIYGRELVKRINFCAGYITINKNVCNHDAGGPAILNGLLIGILSFSSRRCDTPDQPAVFTSLGALVPWLEAIMEKKA